ncbi:MAG: metal ABC transporter substrate-binding protein [Gemmatimonadota bacterium]|nr:metal ABC transporter substrate-binding protein [Gemmatimonadota bacterium]
MAQGLIASAILLSPVTAVAQEPVRVAATLPVYASVARAIGGEHVEATSIASPTEDAHFVRPKPSFARTLRNADLFITTGLDLELWVPALLDRAGNADVAEGGRGYVTAYTGVNLLDVPVATSRSEGDVHLYGNPHLHTDPVRVIQIARNITTGLKRVAPDRAAAFDAGFEDFRVRIYEALVGSELVAILGVEALESLAASPNLRSFLDENELEGTPLSSRLGGWLKTAEAFRGKRMICYHKNWAYFEERFDVHCAEYVEAKPGIPPTPGHVSRLIDMMQSEGFEVLLAASYFDRGKVESVARRGGATAVVVPLYGGTGEVGDYFELVTLWVDGLARAFGG